MSDQAERDALAEVLRDEIAGWPIGSGYYGTSIGTSDANDIADHLVEHVLAQRDRRVRADELREAAGEWEARCTRGHPLDAEVADRLVPWLRERADRIERGE